MKITRKITVRIALFLIAITGIASCGKDSDKTGDAFEGVWKLKAIVQNGTVIDVTQAHLPLIGRAGMEKVLPRFPPYGKYIAFTARSSRGMVWSDHDYPDGSWVGAVGGKFGYLAVIPADGKHYNLDDKSSGAISLTKSRNRGVACDGHLVWR